MLMVLWIFLIEWIKLFKLSGVQLSMCPSFHIIDHSRNMGAEK